MMGAVSEVTVSTDGRMEPARTRGDGSPMLPQSHEHSDQDLQIMVLVVRQQAQQEDRESKLCPFPFLLPAPERGKRSTQLEMAKRAHRKTCPSFALHTGQNSARILMEELPIQ